MQAEKQLSIVTNYLGTPEAMYSSNGEKTWSCQLDSYGKVRNFGFGLSGVDKQGNTIVLHHYKQNPNGDLIAMPAKHHDKPHTNPGQHPFGKKKGGGLSLDERAAFNKRKQEYWKNQAEAELNARGCH